MLLLKRQQNAINNGCCVYCIHCVYLTELSVCMTTVATSDGYFGFSPQ